MNQVKKNNYFLRIVVIIFIIFIGLNISASNYYTNELHNEVVLTKDNMALFEQDIKDGKPLDLKKYQNHEIHDYGNLFSNAGNFIGNKLDYVMLNGIDEGIKVLKKLFSN